MNCTKCGELLTEDSKFCPVCGTPVQMGSVEPVDIQQAASPVQPVISPVQLVISGCTAGHCNRYNVATGVRPAVTPKDFR